MRALKTFLYKGKSLSYKELALVSGHIESVIRNRIKKGWTIECAVETPAFSSFKKGKKKFFYRGKQNSVKTFSDLFLVPQGSVRELIIRCGKNIDEVLQSCHTRNEKIENGIEGYQFVMRKYLTKEHRIKCYKKLKSDYEDIKREAMTRAA